MTDNLPEEIPEPARFNARQQLFIEEFCTGKNCTQAAIAAGYSPESAYNQGSRLMKNDEIRAAVEERLNAYSISAMMATKLNAEIATTRLNDFFTITEVQGYEQEEHYLSVLVDRKREEIAFISGFAHKNGIQLATLTGPTEMGKRLANPSCGVWAGPKKSLFDVSRLGLKCLTPSSPADHARTDRCNVLLPR